MLLYPELLNILLIPVRVFSNIGATAIVGTTSHRVMFVLLTGAVTLIVLLIPVITGFLLILPLSRNIFSLIPADLAYHLQNLQPLIESLDGSMRLISELDNRLMSIHEESKRISFEINEILHQFGEYRRALAGAPVENQGELKDTRRVSMKIDPDGG